ncbi:FYN-binding protein 1-like [Ornithodoros turicata]|uniref:FYN-binding protein 1-like n=1 Tax=Ornithodoros turicata TaxID=34597 RepID=UPI00313A3942
MAHSRRTALSSGPRPMPSPPPPYSSSHTTLSPPHLNHPQDYTRSKSLRIEVTRGSSSSDSDVNADTAKYTPNDVPCASSSRRRSSNDDTSRRKTTCHEIEILRTIRSRSPPRNRDIEESEEVDEEEVDRARDKPRKSNRISLLPSNIIDRTENHRGSTFALKRYRSSSKKRRKTKSAAPVPTLQAPLALEIPVQQPPKSRSSGICGFFASLLGANSSESPQVPPSSPLIIIAPVPSATSVPAPSDSSSSEELQPEFEVCRLDEDGIDLICSKIDLRSMVIDQIEENEARSGKQPIKVTRSRRKKKMKKKKEEKKKEEKGIIKEEEEVKKEVFKITEEVKPKEEVARKEHEEPKKAEATQAKVAEAKASIPVPPKVEAALVLDDQVSPEPLPQRTPKFDIGELLQVDVPVIFVFGGPGSGKRTQCAMIAEKYGFTHILSSDLVRDEVQAGTDVGKAISGVLERGELVPLEYVIFVLKQNIKKVLGTSKGYLIDGFPRNVTQAEIFQERVCKITHVVYFEVSNETMLKRTLERTKASAGEDRTEDVKRSIDVFLNESIPVIEMYQEKTIKISAEEDPEVVFESIVPYIDKITAKA